TSLLVRMNDRLGVGTGPELMTASLQLLSQLEVVVDLTVQDRMHPSRLVRDRLMSVGDVDDAEPACSERDALFDDAARVIGAAMDDRVRHALDDPMQLRSLKALVDDSGDSAHCLVVQSAAVVRAFVVKKKDSGAAQHERTTRRHER